MDKKKEIDKNEEFIKWMGKQLFNVLGIAKRGVTWDKLPPKRHLKRICKKKLSNKKYAFLTTHNKHKTTTLAVLFGGGTIVIKEDLINHVYAPKYDKMGMRRWISVGMIGKKGFKTRFFPMYRYVPDGGATSIFLQHKRYVCSKNDFRPPL